MSYKTVVFFLVLSGCFAVPLSAGAEKSTGDVTLSTVSVAKNIFMLRGKGGNIGIFIGEDGTFMIDDQFAPLTETILEATGAVGGEQPRFLINTHYHPDHTGGNENLGKTGTLIFSHHNVRERLSMGYYLKEFEMKQAALADGGLPVVTFSEDISFHLNGDTVQAVHVAHAHTDGDCFIYFKKANVIHAGDVFFNGFYPFIDVDHGGSLKGMLEAVDRILSIADDKTRIIPGHGPLADRSQLENYRKMLTTVYERLRKLKASGMSGEEAAEEKPLADLDEEWGDGHFDSDSWIEMIYPGV
jgi:glyoxylase-like metal-dependent hydrolase (beta-lactamase superfamily II)